MSAELRNVATGMVLFSSLLLFGSGYMANVFYHQGGHHKLADPVIEGAEDEVASATASITKGSAPDIATLMASADTARGGKLFKKKCTACHTVIQGGKSKTGPNLFAITRRGIAREAGFKYSSGMNGKKSENWTDANLSSFLAKPKAFIARTKMSFAGIKKAGQRANLIAFLKKNGG